MNIIGRQPLNGALFILGLVVATNRAAAVHSVQPVTLSDPSQVAPTGGGGNSVLPLASPDGRYVLFASTANNLVLNTNGNPFMAARVPRENVFLRDRSSNTTVLVSVSISGLAGGNGDSLPIQISSNGRYALFESVATDLVPGDTNGATDVFLRDLVTGTTLLVSTNSFSGGVGNDISRSSTMTPDGHYVAFVSAATNLVAGDTNRITDIFVRDMQAGATVLASAGAMANFNSLRSSSEAPDITPDGRYVAFSSTATNLVSGLTVAGDIFVRDLLLNTTMWASVGARTLFGTSNVLCYNHSISADGNYVAYQTSTNASVGISSRAVIARYNVATGTTDPVSTNAHLPYAIMDDLRTVSMTPNGRFIAYLGNTNANPDVANAVYLWDAQTASSVLISIDLSNHIAVGSCASPVVDPSGRYVVFSSSATNVVTNLLVGDFHLYLRDTQSGTTRLISADSAGSGSPINPAASPFLSADGGLVAFESAEASLVASDRNHDYDIFLHDLAANSTELLSAHDAGLPSLTANGLGLISPNSASADGRFLAFTDEADNLVSNDTNGCRDVYVRDRVMGTNLLISVATNGLAGDLASSDSSISSEGRFVAFTSLADNLVTGDTNRTQDVYLRDVQTSTTSLVSVNTNGLGAGNSASWDPVVSSDGRFVLFRSFANNLATGPFTPNRTNLFLRDRQTATTWPLTTTGVVYSAMSPDGHFIAFSDGLNVRLWDSVGARLLYTNSSNRITGMAISRDGNRLAYWTGLNPSTLYAADRAANSTVAITTAYPAAKTGLQFGLDSRFLTFVARSSPSGPSQVYVYDFLDGSTTLVSRNLNTASVVNSNADSPALSADGRIIAYISSASDIVPGVTNGVPQLFLFDRLSSSTSLLTSNRSAPADNGSLAPVFSGDGQTLFFQSWASDLVSGDFNHASDLYVYPFLYLTVAPAVSGQGSTLSWPAAQGTNYRVEFKDGLNDSNWQTWSGIISIIGTRAFINDGISSANTRFYRVVEL